MQEVDEAVVQLVRDSGKKLTNTINLKDKPFPQVPGVPPAQVIVPKILLPANAPLGSQWGLATAVQNAGAGAPNAPTGNAPGPAQFQPAQAAGAYQIPPTPPNPQGPIQLPLPALGNPGPSGSSGQNMPPPAMRPLKLRLSSSASTLKISRASSANNPQQMSPEVVVNNQPLNNPPQTAGGAKQIQPPAESPRAKPTSLDSVCKCWSVSKPNPASPGKSPRGTPTSLYGVCRSWSIRKCNAEYSSPGDCPCDIKIAVVGSQNAQNGCSPHE